MILYRDKGLQIEAEGQDVYLSLFKPMDSKSLNEILSSLPQVQVTNFLAVREGITKGFIEKALFGCLKAEMEFEISTDEMNAFVKLNVTEAIYDSKREYFTNLVLNKLSEEGVVFGIQVEVIDRMPVGKKVAVAIGLPPAVGEDATVKYMQLSEKKPEMLQDGGVDHYNINLIDPINKGEWMGEKIPAKEGTPGVTVRNQMIGSHAGKDIALKYDSETVEERRMADGRITLHALIDGAVVIKQQRISVDNHLIIHGNVDYSTGNVDFDGYVTVLGTVADGFVVKATNDISIQGDMGVGAVALIESVRGSIFIKGGVNGKNQALLKAGRHIYVKYCKEARLESKVGINVGLYVYDSEINTGRFEMPNPKSKLVGGKVIANHQVIAGNVGNQNEKPTEVQVIGFDRLNIRTELDNLVQYSEAVIEKANKLKRQVEIFKLNYNQLDQKAINTYYVMQNEFEKMINEIGVIKEKINELEEMLRIRGDGEVKIMQQAFPKTLLEIKNMKKRINEATMGSYYVKDNVLHYTD